MRSSTDFIYANKTNYLTGVKHFSPLGTQNIGYTYGDVNQGQMPDQVYEVSWNGAEKLNYAYDPLGRLTSKTILVGGGVSDAPHTLDTQYTYFDVGTDKTTTLLKSLQTPAGTYNYTYDAVGNITSVQSVDDRYHYSFDYTSSFAYDDLNQLVRENNPQLGKTYTYSYVNGNITERKEYAYTTGELGEVLDTRTWSYTDGSWRDLLTSYNGISISYDEIGNPTEIDSQSLTWNGRQLQQIVDGTNTYSYAYNTDGQRVSKTVNGVTTEYFYNDNILARQKTGDKTLVFMYDNNGDPFGFTYDGTTFHYVKNAQNDVVGLECGGNVVAYYFYDAWGNTRIINDAGYAIYDQGHPAYINPIRYRSYYYDHETNLYFLNSRYYSPDICRFLNADGVVNANRDVLGNNLFAYCSNDPVNNTDDNGCGKFSNWFKSAAQTINNWWNSTPPSHSYTVPSSSQIIPSAISRGSDSLLGATANYTGKFSRVVHVELNFTKKYKRGAKVQINPTGVTEYPYKGISTKINKVSAVITGVSLALDLGNTWTANNSNTNGDRVVKSLIQIGGVVAGVGAGAAIAAVTGPTLVGVVAFVSLSCVTGIVIDEACTALRQSGDGSMIDKT